MEELPAFVISEKGGVIRLSHKFTHDEVVKHNKASHFAPKLVEAASQDRFFDSVKSIILLTRDKDGKIVDWIWEAGADFELPMWRVYRKRFNTKNAPTGTSTFLEEVFKAYTKNHCEVWIKDNLPKDAGTVIINDASLM
jgi:hypothetical protein